jgi:pyrimidine deaminase RibD-like protein
LSANGFGWTCHRLASQCWQRFFGLWAFTGISGAASGKVGAVIAIGNKPLGRGRRGRGNEGDDDHAEQDALKQVADVTQLPQATLYTTLEPCTRAVRTKELECCTELILQHKIKKVFIPYFPNRLHKPELVTYNKAA